MEDSTAYLITAMIFYFLPAGIAAMRRHHQAMAVFMLNLFLGWTGIGWIAALIWAFSWRRQTA